MLTGSSVISQEVGINADSTNPEPIPAPTAEEIAQWAAKDPKKLLFEAVEEGNLTKLHFAVITFRADVNITDNDVPVFCPLGITPLYIAAEKGSVNVVSFLLKNGANVNTKRNDGQAPLHIAAVKGHVKIMQLLLNDNAEVNAKDKDGTTPLHLAAYELDTEAVRTLLLAGADINAADTNWDNTALGDVVSKMSSSFDDKKEMVVLLIHFGADIYHQPRPTRAVPNPLSLLDSADKRHPGFADWMKQTHKDHFQYFRERMLYSAGNCPGNEVDKLALVISSGNTFAPQFQSTMDIVNNDHTDDNADNMQVETEHFGNQNNTDGQRSKNRNG